MVKFRYIEDMLRPSEKPCAHDGCPFGGEHRAPISPSRPHEYQYFCLEHVKEFNKKWDFFKEKSQEEIESFQKDAFTGHRPTWKIGARQSRSTAKLSEALGRFMDEDIIAPKPAIPALCAKQRHALEQLDLDHPVTEREVKKRFKKLARQYHPDHNQGDKKAEERFKEINVAYRYLIDHYCPHITTA